MRDYRELLIKYIFMVGETEGTDFLDHKEDTEGSFSFHISREEMLELVKLSKEGESR